MHALLSRSPHGNARVAVLLLTLLSASCGFAADAPRAERANALPTPPPSRSYDAQTMASPPAELSRPDAISAKSVVSGSGVGATGFAAPPADVSPTMVMRNGTASVQVDSLELGILALQRLATSLGGYVGNTSLSAGENQVRSATLVLKIPAAHYDNALAGLTPLGTIEVVSSTAEDVGEEFVDITARTTNARRLEERLITLLATRAGKLEDVLAVERELARVREEIERYDGRLRYLRLRVATSTLSVSIHEPAPLIETAPGAHPIVDAFKEAWQNFVLLVSWCIASLGVVLPVLVLAALGWFGVRHARR